MLKLCGALLLLCVPVVLALGRYWAYRRRMDTIAALLQMLSFAADHICSQLLPFSALAEVQAEQGPERLRQFWQRLMQEMQSGGDPDPVWQRELQRIVPQEEFRILQYYPALLRSYDADQVAREITQLRAALEACEREVRGRFRRDFKARTGVQVAAAALLLILLI